MKKLLTVVPALLLCLCLASCGEKAQQKALNEIFSADGYEIAVLGGYWADPVVDLDGDRGRFLLRVRVKNTGAERREVKPGELFSLTGPDKEAYEYADAAFASVKGYLAAGDSTEGQLAFLVPKGETGVALLRAGKAEVALDMSAAQVKAHAPLVLAGMNRPVRIDQLQYTATRMRRVEGTNRYEIFLDVLSVSAGAPSNIEDRHFAVFAEDYMRLALVKRNLPDSIATNDSASGSVVVECPADKVPAVLGLTRHISGQDYSGIALTE